MLFRSRQMFQYALYMKLTAMDESKFTMVSTVELKDPTTILLVSIFLGTLGIDRFMLGDTGMGILKLLTVALEITDRAALLVRAPLKMSDREIERFVLKYRGWAEEKLKTAQKRAAHEQSITEREKELREKAEHLLPELTARYSAVMGLKPSSVKITSAKKRFGSCSGKNGICFSWRLMAYPMPAIEYVVVHELAHIKHHNHSAAFYALIGRYMPDYRKREKLLKKTPKL